MDKDFEYDKFLEFMGHLTNSVPAVAETLCQLEIWECMVDQDPQHKTVSDLLNSVKNG